MDQTDIVREGIRPESIEISEQTIDPRLRQNLSRLSWKYEAIRTEQLRPVLMVRNHPVTTDDFIYTFEKIEGIECEGDEIVCKLSDDPRKGYILLRKDLDREIGERMFKIVIPFDVKDGVISEDLGFKINLFEAEGDHIESIELSDLDERHKILYCMRFNAVNNEYELDINPAIRTELSNFLNSVIYDLSCIESFDVKVDSEWKEGRVEIGI
jgi:hypothetical protein